MWSKCVVLLVLLFIVYAITRKESNKKQYTCSRVDKRCYETYHNHRGSADTLAWLNGQNIALMRYMREKMDEGSYNAAQARYVTLILARYDPDVLRQNIPKSLTYTSYVLNKGEEIGYCLDGYSKRDTLLFVNLHEMSHLADDSDENHGDNFWRAFAFVSGEAALLGMHTPVNYAEAPTKYCGLTIDYHPMFDPTYSS
jgi:hypothetical protein